MSLSTMFQVPTAHTNHCLSAIRYTDCHVASTCFLYNHWHHFSEDHFFLLYCFLISVTNAEADVWVISHITDKVWDIKPHHDFYLRHSTQFHLTWQQSLLYSFRELGGFGKRPETEVILCLAYICYTNLDQCRFFLESVKRKRHFWGAIHFKIVSGLKLYLFLFTLKQDLLRCSHYWQWRSGNMNPNLVSYSWRFSSNCH